MTELAATAQRSAPASLLNAVKAKGTACPCGAPARIVDGTGRAQCELCAGRSTPHRETYRSLVRRDSARRELDEMRGGK